MPPMRFRQRRQVARRVYRKPTYGTKYPGQFRRLRGRGGYWSDAWNWVKNRIPKGTWSKIGSAVGSGIGGRWGMSAPGGAVGGALGNKFSELVGFGSYKVKKNTLGNMAGIRTQTDPPIMANSKCGIRIKHREFLQDITTQNAFTLASYAINPGVSTSFPWLSGIAQNFQQYQIHGMIYEYISTSGDAVSSTNSSLGTVCLATEYNSALATFINKQAMENSEFAVSGKPSVNIIHPIECDPKQTSLDRLYVRTGAVPSGQDQRFYDLGLFQLATVGAQTTFVAGELHCSYDIEFFKAVESSALDLEQNLAHYQMIGASGAANQGFGLIQTQKADTIGISFANNVLTMPVGTQGTYFIDYSVVGTPQLLTTPSFPITNGSYLSLWNADAASSITNTATTGGTFMFNAAFKVINPEVVTTIQCTGGALPINPTSGDLFVLQVSSNLNS